MTVRNVLGALAVLAGLAAGTPWLLPGSYPGRTGGGHRTGPPAPPLDLSAWLNTGPLTVENLRGRVLLVRWWTDSCPFCSTSAPSLRTFDERYRQRGLTVIGVFHPKPPGDRSIDRVRRGVERFGFTFPVAVDPDWDALRRWWGDDEPLSWTSVSFLVDRSGRIRYVHPGGEYHETPAGGRHWKDHATCLREYREIEKTIVGLLEEDGPARP